MSSSRKQTITLTKEDKYLCDGCPAHCCHNLAMTILKPLTKSEIEDVKWYLHFDTIKIFIRKKRWHLLIAGKCIYLDKKNRCTIYKKRSIRCRQHPASDCERHGSYYDVLISTPEELQNHLDKNKKIKKGGKYA
jgi:Fe-S-cluster containining protein